MSKLIYIQASPRPERSYSRVVANAFVKAYKKDNPNDEIDTIDLFHCGLPPFSGAALQGKYSLLHGKERSEEEVNAWRSIEKIIEEFKSADKYVFAIPMWNFGIPYRLKQYLDILIRPVKACLSPIRHSRFQERKKMCNLAVYARGGEYPEGSDAAAMDFQKKYMDLVFGFMGFTDIRSIIVEPTLAGGPETADTRKKAAIAEAQELARKF